MVLGSLIIPGLAVLVKIASAVITPLCVAGYKKIAESAIDDATKDNLTDAEKEEIKDKVKKGIDYITNIKSSRPPF